MTDISGFEIGKEYKIRVKASSDDAEPEGSAETPIVSSGTGEKAIDEAAVAAALCASHAALCLACHKNDFDAVKHLVELEHVSVDAADAAGVTAVMAASGYYGNINIVKYLVEDQKADIHAVSADGQTVLMQAAAFGQIEIVKYCLDEHQFNANTRDNNNYTAVNHLLSAMGSGVTNSKDKGGPNTGHWAVFEHLKEIGAEKGDVGAENGDLCCGEY